MTEILSSAVNNRDATPLFMNEASLSLIMLATFLHLLPGMGTKVHCESCFPGYFSMRDLNEDSNSCSWPLYYGDRAFTNGQYYNGFLPRTITDVYPGYDKDVVKQTMLEHEAIFKTQVCLNSNSFFNL